IGPPSAALRRTFQDFGIDDIYRVLGRERDDLVKNIDELRFVFLMRHIADVRRRDDLFEAQQRQIRIAHGLVFEDIDGGIAGAAARSAATSAPGSISGARLVLTSMASGLIRARSSASTM